MKCFDCKEHDAEFVLVEHDQVLPLCEGCLGGHTSIEGEMNLDYWPMDQLEIVFEEINKNLKYNESMYARLLKEYSELKKEAGKSEAIETLMREQRYIKIFHWEDGSVKSYSIGAPVSIPMVSRDGPNLASAILAILFPDEDVSE